MATKIKNKTISKDISDTLSVVGIVVIENGENKVIGRNHWVGQGLETIGSYLVGSAGNGAASTIYIGSDTLIPTTVSMTGLIVPIGSAPGTAPNTFNVSYSINLSSTIPATVVYNAIWNARTVSGTLGEVGLYLQGYGGLSGSTYATNPGLGARMAAADGAFTPFVINTSVALNVSWFIRFVYSSGTSVTQYITSPSLPSDPSQQPIIGITNSQSTPVPAGLQVMWHAPISSLQIYFNQYGINLNSNLSNMRILYNGQYVPAWIESINNGIATIWFKTPVSIPANSSISLCLNAGPSFNFDGVYWGEAPQLSPTYGQYDNGANVFNFYDNFAGTTIKSVWTQIIASGGTITQNNGITFTTNSSGSYVGLILTNGIPSPQILEGYVTSWSGKAVGLAEQNGNAGNEPMYVFNGWTGGYEGYSPSTSGGMISGVTSLSTAFAFTSGIEGLAWVGNSQEVWYNNYNTYTTNSNGAGNLPSTINLSFGIYYYSPSSSITFQWLRTRAYPPNGVMPSVSLL
jgi:hypothetical protein